jgi:flavorubredoxin
MQTTTHEIAPDIFRFSTLVPEIAGGFTFNQFLVRADEPMLFHCGPRGMFPLVSEAVGKLIPLHTLRWVSFGHVESDECGSMNKWLAAAPNAQVMQGQIACDVSLNDLADRPPRALADDEVLDIGGKRLRFLYTPHVPHGWEAGVFMEETTKTLLCGDLFTHTGDGPPITTGDIVGPALAAEAMFHAMSMAPNTRATLERLSAFRPTTLGVMHGSSFSGDGAKALKDLAAGLYRS